ncbi:MAG: hypothetical protein JRI23_00145, partial [Deltaproteobacteria bacterium]|nr:hypothetical protein [Deltaproteobacteria bacterium]MBW2529853.1 hypothetical protein [Deltaproteobacteria bacterium]
MESYRRPATRLVGLLVAATLGTGCAASDLPSESEHQASPPWGAGCLGGKCDGLDGVTLLICGPRDVARGEPGCTSASAMDIGIDPLIAEKMISLRIVLRGLDQPGVTVAVEIEDDQGQVVRTIGVGDRSDGSQLVHWNGHDDQGNDVTAPWHTATLRARYGDESVTGDGWVIASLFNLPDEGDGYTHPRGTDRKDTD